MVFLTEADRAGRHSLHHALIQQAKEKGLAGATVWRGIEGFGRSRHLRTSRFVDHAQDLPVVVEVVDRPERITEFLAAISELARGCLITREPVTIRRWGSGPDGA